MTDEPLRPAPKIFKETCEIRWNELTTQEVHNFVRGLSPYPAAWTTLEEPGGKRTVLKVYRTHPEQQTHSLPVGTLETDGRKWLRVAAKDGYVYLEELQLAGKKKMPVADFLRGAHVEGARLV